VFYNPLEHMALTIGTQLGSHEITALLGKGGMGEVYRARDLKLKREVAIKILPEEFSRDAERVSRFQREAEVLASLNHPNIATIYDLQEAGGAQFLVLELVEGETLADRIARGPIPVEEALRIAGNICEALEAAHEKGIIHRDLKPANVKMTPDGNVKVLDFGLAKATDNISGSPTLSNSPTMVSGTMGGIILGTAAYMSPEQARGSAVDKRADVWAFGAVLYEMLAGKPAFRGGTTSDILAAVLKEEPDWSRIPARVQPLLRRCLVKDPKHRLRDVGDAMPLFDAVPEVAPVGRPRPWVVAAMLAVALAITSAAWWRATRASPPQALVRLNANLPAGAEVPRDGNQVALSPDGTRIVISVHDAAGKLLLVTRRLDQSQFTPVSGAEGALMPFFSPDGQWIGFFADGKLKKVEVQGGSPITLCDAPRPSGASWGDDNKIIAAFNSGRAGLVRVPSGGGSPTPATVLGKEKGETAHIWPQVLPGSHAVLFTAVSGSYDDASLDVVLFKNGERKTVQRGGFFGRYLATSNGAGHLVYMLQSTMLAVPFDLSRLAVTGPSQPVLEDVSTFGRAGSTNFDFSGASSGSGTFVYLSRTGEPPQSIFWLDSGGKTHPLHAAQGIYSTPRFSPDGKRLAFAIVERAWQGDIWVEDLDRDVVTRLTHLPGAVNQHPVWTPDGANLIFESPRLVAPSLYWIRADGSGAPQPMTDTKIRRTPYGLSPNGKRLVYGQNGIWTAPVESELDQGSREVRLGKAERFLQAAPTVISATFSPDGRWMAYSSDETGIFEVYVQPFPGPGGKIPISTGGGSYPIWSRNGRDLFFLGPDQRIIVVSYTARGDSFVAGKPHVWSEKRLLDRPYETYDLAPDGERFAVILYADGTAEPITQLTVLLNFFDELKRRVPVR
jgi:serine/threonine-protein kinase